MVDLGCLNINYMHKFIKLSGCKSEKEFLEKYPTESAFFSDFPEAKYHLSSGQANVEQRQSLPGNRDTEQSKQFTNVKQETKRGEDASLPRRQVGGVAGESETPFTKGKLKKTKKKMVEGGDPSYEVEIHDRNWGYMPTNSWMAPPKTSIGLDSGWEGFGNDANLIQSQGIPEVYSDIKGYQNIQQHSGAALGSGDYSLDRIREQNMRMGGYLRKYQPGGNFGPAGNPIDDNYTPDIIGTPPPPKVYPTDTGVVQQRPPAAWMKKKNGTYMDNEQATANINYGSGSVDAYNSKTGNTQFPITDINERPESRQHVSPFLVGAAAVTGAVGGFAAASSVLGKQKTAEDFYRYAQQRGLSRNEGASGSMGDYDQFGNFKPNMRTPSQPGQFYKHGGHTWNGDMETFFQEGGETQGYNEGDELEVTEEQAAQLIKAGYKIKRIK